MPVLGYAPSSKPTYPPHFDIERVIRPNILSLHPYRCARDDYSEGILLDANENALGHSISKSDASKSEPNGHIPTQDTELEIDSTLSLDLHRYPDPSHPLIKSRIEELRGIPSPDHVFLGAGSDEVIDLLMRMCVAPEREKVLITPPTYGMYAVCAHVGVVKVNLELSGDAGEGARRAGSACAWTRWVLIASANRVVLRQTILRYEALSPVYSASGRLAWCGPS